MPDVQFTLKIYVHTYRIYEGQGRTDESPSFEKCTTMNFAYGKSIATKEKRLEEESPDVKGNQSLGGRPVGSTMEAKVELKS